MEVEEKYMRNPTPERAPYALPVSIVTQARPGAASSRMQRARPRKAKCAPRAPQVQPQTDTFPAFGPLQHAGIVAVTHPVWESRYTRQINTENMHNHTHTTHNIE